MCVCSVLDCCLLLLLLWTVTFYQLHLWTPLSFQVPSSLIRGDESAFTVHIDPSICAVAFVSLPKDSGTKRDTRQDTRGTRGGTQFPGYGFVWCLLVTLVLALLFVCSLGVVEATPVARRPVGLPLLLLVPVRRRPGHVRH